MSDTAIPFRCHVENTNPSKILTLEILVDNNQVYNSSITDPVDITFELDDDEGEHEVVFVMSGKTHEHTVVNDQGEIVEDVMLAITDITVDDINIDYLFSEKSVYTHNFNGSQPEVNDRFFGNMGCNGRVSFKLSTPFYVWVLENS